MGKRKGEERSEEEKKRNGSSDFDSVSSQEK